MTPGGPLTSAPYSVDRLHPAKRMSFSRHAWRGMPGFARAASPAPTETTTTPPWFAGVRGRAAGEPPSARRQHGSVAWVETRAMSGSITGSNEFLFTVERRLARGVKTSSEILEGVARGRSKGGVPNVGGVFKQPTLQRPSRHLTARRKPTSRRKRDAESRSHLAENRRLSTAMDPAATCSPELVSRNGGRRAPFSHARDTQMRARRRNG